MCACFEHVCSVSAELEELLLSLKQVRGSLSDQQSQNDVELVLALLNKVILASEARGLGLLCHCGFFVRFCGQRLVTAV